MKLKIQDARGGNILIDCEPNWLLETLLTKYKEIYKTKHPNDIIKSISFTYNGDFFQDSDSNKTLDEIGFEDGEQIVFVIGYDGGLI